MLMPQFRHSHVIGVFYMVGNDRYLIYELLGRFVNFKFPIRFGGEEVEGVCDRVSRSIFTNDVEITLDGIRHKLPEPSAIIMEGEGLSFFYGDTDSDEETDQEMFDSMFYTGSFGGSVHDHLLNTEANPITKVAIRMGPVRKSPKLRWKHRSSI